MKHTIEKPGDRLLYAIKYSDMTQRKFAGLIGMSPNGLNSIVKGRKRLSRTLALATELITGVRAEWILNNELPIDLDPISKIEPWDRIVLEFYRPNDMNIFERVFGEIEQQTSPFRNSIDQEIVNLLDMQLNQLLLNQNILKIVEYDGADSKIEITILEVSDSPYTINKGEQFDTEVTEWKLSVKVKAVWLDFKKGEALFDATINEWGIYGNDLDISSDGIDNDGDGLIDSEDSDEIGAPRDSARLIAINKIAEKVLTKITSTW